VTQINENYTDITIKDDFVPKGREEDGFSFSMEWV
jgi:hypothetical protein